MTDWMTCRVVRDGKGRLRTDDGPIRGLVGDGLVSAESAAAYEHMLGPLVPVLDADGQPVVRTVGDLTARHLGRLIDDGNPAYVVRLGSVGHSSTGTRYTGHVIRRDNGKVAGNVRCERVSPSTPVAVLS